MVVRNLARCLLGMTALSSGVVHAVCGSAAGASAVYRYTLGSSVCTSLEEIEDSITGEMPGISAPDALRPVYPGIDVGALSSNALPSLTMNYRPNGAVDPNSSVLASPPATSTPSYRLFVKNQPGAIAAACTSAAPSCTSAGCSNAEDLRKLMECQFSATWNVGGSLYCWQRTGVAALQGTATSRLRSVAGAGNQSGTFNFGPSSSTSLDSGQSISIPAQTCSGTLIESEESKSAPTAPLATQTFSWGVANSNAVTCSAGSKVNGTATSASNMCSTEYIKLMIGAPAFTEAPGQCGVGNPCFPGNGNKRVDESILRHGAIALDLHYNSLRQVAPLAYVDRNWSHTYAKRVLTQWMISGHYVNVDPETKPIAQVTGMVVQDELAQLEAYVATSTAGTFRSTATTGKYLVYKAGASAAAQTWELTYPGGVVETYDRAGRLISIASADDPVDTLQLSYGGNPIAGALATDTARLDPMFWRLAKITDGAGRFVTLEYENPPFFRLKRVLSDDGVEQANFGYDADYRMTSVARFGKTRTFVYNEPANAPLAATVKGYWLTGIVDEDGRRYATYTYDSWGRASGSWHGTVTDSAGKVAVEYLTDYSSRVTHPSGRQVTYDYYADKPYRRVSKMTDTDGEISLEYSAAGRLTARVDRRGTRTQFEYSADGVFETARTEAVSKPEQRRIETDWDAVRSLRTAERVYADPPAGPRVKLSDTRYRYATGSARVVGVDRVDPVTGTTRTTAITHCTANDVTNAATTNCAFAGQVRTIDGLRTEVPDVTTFAYRTAESLTGCGTAAGPCWRKGDLWKATNALGHVNQVASYDRAGRPARLVDPNGTITDLTYNNRGWLKERAVRASASGVADVNADSSTRYDYDESGNVTYAYPAGGHGAYLRFAYDDAHRVKTVTDSLGNRIAYELDKAGNRTSEKTYDTASVLRRSLAREYSTLNRLKRVLDANQQVVQQFSVTGGDIREGYDANGNPRRMSDGRNVVTDQTYDALDRLVTTMQDYSAPGDPGATSNATTTLTYDAADRVKRVLDPDAIPTDYTYNGFDEVTTLASRDGGNRSYVYDAAGNVTQETDARGIMTERAYDALNRPISENFPLTMSGLGKLMEYDQPDSETGCAGSFPIGRLTRIGDVEGLTTYCYDRRGNVTRKTVETVWSTRSIAYEYTRGNLLKSVTYPDGSIVRYTRDAMARIGSATWQASAITTPVSLLSGVTYYPFGPVKTLTFGNGRTLTKSYDANYAIDSVASSAPDGVALDFGVDVMGNIADASATLGGTPLRRYVYDDLYRLAGVNTAAGAPLETYGYNKTGDRTSKNLGGTLESYAYTPGTHRLSNVGGVARGSDANGNTTTGIAASAMTYDDMNRLSAAPALSGQPPKNTYYFYNGLGQRVRKFNDTSRNDAWYGENGQRLSDIDYTRVCGSLGRAAADAPATTTDWPVEVCPGGGQVTTTLVRSMNYIYLDDVPVAVTEQAASASVPSLLYVESDHLGTPRTVVEPSTNAVKWRWDFFGNAFGEHAPTVPVGGVALNMRYPGQFFDSETGLNYNYFRDYEPRTGRYVESDPIGLAAGLNQYSYVNSKPFTQHDFFGLEGSGPWNRNPFESMYERGLRDGKIAQALNLLAEHAAELKRKNIRNVDQFYHCLGACRATKATGDRTMVLALMSGKESIDYLRNKLGLYKDEQMSDAAMLSDMAGDVAVNEFGASCEPGQDCVQRCKGLLDLIPQGARSYMSEYRPEWNLDLGPPR